MSNPLIKPGDPRFQRQSLQGAGGENPYADKIEQTDSERNDTDAYEAGGDVGDRPFLPRYEVQQQSRSALLLVLASAGWAGAIVGAIALSGIWPVGWVCPLLGAPPAAAAWLLAWEYLKAVNAGAIDEGARPRLRLAMVLGWSAVLACLGIVGAMVYRQMNFLPDFI